MDACWTRAQCKARTHLLTRSRTANRGTRFWGEKGTRVGKHALTPAHPHIRKIRKDGHHGRSPHGSQRGQRASGIRTPPPMLTSAPMPSNMAVSSTSGSPRAQIERAKNIDTRPARNKKFRRGTSPTRPLVLPQLVAYFAQRYDITHECYYYRSCARCTGFSPLTSIGPRNPMLRILRSSERHHRCVDAAWPDPWHGRDHRQQGVGRAFARETK